jgi:hypothetical protein
MITVSRGAAGGGKRFIKINRPEMNDPERLKSS